MKSQELHKEVVRLKRTCTTKQVADMLQIPIGTVKTICSRKGTTRNNSKLRDFFRLPDISISSNTELKPYVSLPTPDVVTGDEELDAVLWLRKIVQTGDVELIQKAIQASERIKSSEDDLEKRYSEFLLSLPNSNTMSAVFGSFGFANIKGLASKVLDTKSRQQEALSRFGSEDKLIGTLAQEKFCIDVLEDMPENMSYKEKTNYACEKFSNSLDMLPNTLSDCVYELNYWSSLERLRSSFGCIDPIGEVIERENFLFYSMSHLRPKTREEGVAVFRYLADNDCMQREFTDEILRNLIR